MTYSKHGEKINLFTITRKNEAKGPSYKIFKWAKEKLL